MRNKIVVYLAVILVVVADLLPIWCGPVDSIVLAAESGLLVVIGSYIGFDFSAIVDGTKRQPPGQFIAADKGKYLRMIFCMLLTTAECLIVGIIVKGIPTNAVAMGLFATLSTMGIYVAGMKANKKAAKKEGV